MNNTWMVDLSDAVAVYRDYAGKLRVDQSYQMTTLPRVLVGVGCSAASSARCSPRRSRAGASAAAAAGALAAGSLSGVALGATLGAIDAQDWKETFGISEDFVQRVGTMLQPGDSAVFVLARTINPDLVADAFKGYGGTVLRTTLSKEQQAKVEATLQSR